MASSQFVALREAFRKKWDRFLWWCHYRSGSRYDFGISYTEDGVRWLKDGYEIRFLRWDEMRTLGLSQQDLITYEEAIIWLSPEVGDGIWIHEVVPGFYEFQKFAEQYFSGFYEAVRSFQYKNGGKFSNVEPEVYALELGQPVRRI